MNTLALTAIWLLVIQIFVTTHYIIIERFNKRPYHEVSFITAVVISIFCSMVYNELDLRIISIVYMGLMYWIVFPLQLNLFRDKPLLHLGDTVLDNLERKMKSPGATLGMKFVLMTMCLFYILNLPNPWA